MRRIRIMKNVLKVLFCGAVLVFAQNVQAQEETTPVQLPDGIKVVQIGDQQPGIQGGIIYDNTMDTGFYFPPPAGAVPVEIADDVILPDPSMGAGLAHINSFVFNYATATQDVSDCTVGFYTLDAGDAGPDYTAPLAVLTLSGLPGSTDGSVVVFSVTVDLAGQGLDFDFPGTTLTDGTAIGWNGYTFSNVGFGLLTATGGGSHDLFFANVDLNSPYEPLRGFWFFGGSPEASFHIQLLGVIN
jgi:hypothetical protein